MGAYETGYQGNFNPFLATSVANGQTTTSAILTGGFALCGILFRALTSTTITFTVSDTVGGVYVPLKSTTSGSALSYTVAANTYAAIDPKDFQGVQFLKIVCGSSEGGARTLLLAMKGF